MSVSGIIGTFLGVRSPGTAYVLLHHYMGEIDGSYRAWGLPKGGTGAVADAIAAAARELGVEIRVERAGRPRADERTAAPTGVVLENGDEIAAKAVISGVDPHRTFLRLVGEKHLDPEFAKQVKRFKMRGSSGKVNLALDALPEFACLPGDGPHLRGDITIAPSIDYLERAYDDAKYGALLAAAVHGHRDPVAHRPDGGAAGQAHHVDLRAVRALQPQGGRRRLAEPARGVRRRGDRHAVGVHAEPEEPHPAPPGADAAGTSSRSTA